MGVTLTDAVIAALQQSLQRSSRRRSRPLNRKKVDAICAELRALPVVDGRSPDEILEEDIYGSRR